MLWAVQEAKKAGALISYDPNYRPFLWKEERHARNELLHAAELANLLKVSEGELTFLAGTSDLSKGAALLQALGPKYVFVTCGEEGCFFRTPKGETLLPAYPVHAVDTTGAGDAFWGALLSQIHGHEPAALDALSQEDWIRAVRFANAAGALTTTQKGAIPAMPDQGAIEAFLSKLPDSSEPNPL